MNRYLGYARQDRRLQNGEAVGARMIAGRYNRILSVDMHNPAI